MLHIVTFGITFAHKSIKLETFRGHPVASNDVPQKLRTRCKNHIKQLRFDATIMTFGVTFAHTGIKLETFSAHPVGIQRRYSKAADSLQKSYKTVTY